MSSAWLLTPATVMRILVDSHLFPPSRLSSIRSPWRTRYTKRRRKKLSRLAKIIWLCGPKKRSTPWSTCSKNTEVTSLWLPLIWPKQETRSKGNSKCWRKRIPLWPMPYLSDRPRNRQSTPYPSRSRWKRTNSSPSERNWWSSWCLYSHQYPFVRMKSME